MDVIKNDLQTKKNPDLKMMTDSKLTRTKMIPEQKYPSSKRIPDPKTTHAQKYLST